MFIYSLTKHFKEFICKNIEYFNIFVNISDEKIETNSIKVSL